MARTIAIVAASLVALVVSPSVASTPISTPTPTQTYAAKIMSATNAVRTNHAQARFAGNLCIKGFAIRQARRMANQERMFHQDLGPVVAKCGLRTAGENVAFGFPTGRSVVLLGWVRSPSHLANILDGHFRLLGSAARRSDDGVWYAAQVFGTRL